MFNIKALLIIGGLLLASLPLAYCSGRNDGIEKQKADQKEIDDEARERMQSVPDATSAAVADSLRKGTF